MDSITHLVLGAAIGELTLGKKIGNRALLWGAIGETIPDLDVFAGPFLTDLDAMAFHRGFTHSIVFAILAPVAFGWLVYKLYSSGTYSTKWYKGIITGINVVLLLGLTIGINYLFRHQSFPFWVILFLSVSVTAYLLMRLYKFYWKKELEQPVTTFRQWYWLFFLTFSTHILLDCCTAYGTQVFQPFSNYRAAFNNMAIVDPMYTIPFMICMIVMASLKRNTRKRTLWNWLGLGISCTYLLFTFFNKRHVDTIFERALAHRHIEPTRCRATPTIFNNILWACVAEDPDNFYVGEYSLFDSDPYIHHLNVIPKNDSISQVLQGQKEYDRIRWFSNYYLAEFKTDSAVFLCDLRYGGFGDTIRDHTDLFMNFKVTQENGVYKFEEYREPMKESVGDAFASLWRRIKGY